jgi:hypothetical protein
MIVAVIALFSWLAHSAVAGAAPATPNTAAPAATQPYGAPSADRQGHPCPEEGQGSGGSGAQAPAPSQGSGNADL